MSLKLLLTLHDANEARFIFLLTFLCHERLQGTLQNFDDVISVETELESVLLLNLTTLIT